MVARLIDIPFMKQILAFFLFLFFSVSLFGQDNYFRQTYVFDGSIKTDKGQELKINMNFLVLLDSTIVGSYYYKPSSGSLKIVGQLRIDNSFILTERNDKDSVTGYFYGNLTIDKRNASGQWTSPTKDILFTFQLNREEGKS